MEIPPPSPAEAEPTGSPSRPGRRKLQGRRVLFWGLALLLVLGVGSMAFPIWNVTCERSASSKALICAKQLALSAKVYASDHNGAFPAAEKTSNQAFQQLIDQGYAPDGELFFVRQSAWCVGEPVADGTLNTGENHWAYFSRLKETDPGEWPLISDPWMPGTEAQYTKKPGVRGSTWGKDNKVIVIQVDMSGKFRSIERRSGTVIWKDDSGAKQFLLWPGFPVKTGWLENAVPLLPAQ